MVGISWGFLDILKFQFYSDECVWSRGGLRASVCSSVFLGGYQWLALSLWNIYQPVLCLNDRVRIPRLVMKPGREEEGKKKMDCWERKEEGMKKKKKDTGNPEGRGWVEWEEQRDDRASHSWVNSIALCHPLFSTPNLCRNTARTLPLQRAPHTCALAPRTPPPPRPRLPPVPFYVFIIKT